MEITLFLGAGASVFAKMPTTKDLVGEVLHQVSHREKWESPTARNLAKNIVSEHEDKDVEELYQTIRDMIDAEKRHRTVVEYKTTTDVSRHMRGITQDRTLGVTTISETDDIDESVRTLETLEMAIRNALLASLMVKPDNVEEVVSTYDALFQFVTRCILTTNYDNVLETYCEQKGLHLVNGFKKSHLGDRRTWDGYKQPQNGAWRGRRGTLHLVKLHGSITWQKDGDGTVLEIGRPGLRDTDRDVMITPTLGRKDYNNGIFPMLRAEFKKILAETDLLIVVGFSFRDPQINQMLRSRLTRSGGNPDPMWLLYVGPDPEYTESDDGLKELIGLKDEPRQEPVYGKCDLWDYSLDAMPYVYAYYGEFDLDTALSMASILEAMGKVCGRAASDQKP